jgi:hypothetical protein
VGNLFNSDRAPMIFATGELVGVPCATYPGPFSNERLVKVETESGAIWGFVTDNNLQVADSQGADTDRGYVKSAVIEQASESILATSSRIILTSRNCRRSQTKSVAQ